MVRLIVIAAWTLPWLTSLPSWAEGPPAQGTSPSASSSSPMPPLYGGMPWAEARKIVSRHVKEIMEMPGVVGVGVGKKGFRVFVYLYTNDQGERPRTFPAEIQTLSQKVIEGLGVEIFPLYALPPPPGFIVLRPGGIQERADTCPEDFAEQKDSHGWRFCVDPQNPPSLPPLWVPPIAGIPQEECLKILERRRGELSQLPGVHVLGLGLDGILVEADDPSVVPASVEGLPIKIEPRIPKSFTPGLSQEMGQ